MSIFKRKRRNAKGEVVTDATWTVNFVDHASIRRRVPAFRDKGASAELERNIQRLVSVRQAGGTLDTSANRFLESCPAEVRDYLAEWGVIAAERAAGSKPLIGYVQAWGEHLRARQCAEKHCVQAIARVKRIFEECRIIYWTDLKAEKVEAWLATSRRGGMSNRTSNSYLSSGKAFCAWMKITGYVSENPLSRLGKVNEAVDIRHERREPTDAELGTLIAVARASKKTYWNMRGIDRMILYILAARTGLRWSELKSLTRSSFNLTNNPPTVTVSAGAAKNRRTDTIPLRPEVARAVSVYFEQRPGLPLAKALPMPVGNKGGAIMALDLKTAGIARVDEVGTVLDFHSLRHYFISSLARAGVHPKIAQDLARHSSIELTMKRYTHTRLESRVEALAKLSEVTPVLPEEMLQGKTGTDNLTVTSEAEITDTPRDTFSPNQNVQIRTYMEDGYAELVGAGVVSQKYNPLQCKGFAGWSGRRESNPHDQLGRLELCH